MSSPQTRRLPETAPLRPGIAGERAAEVRTRLFAYLDRLGVQDPALKASLAEESLLRARRRVAPGCEEELLRRALEELQRRLDGALARTLALSGTRDAHAIAAARAALLLDESLRPKTELLLRGSEDLQELAERLRPALPSPVPPEAPLSMHDQAISFFFARSPQ